jgi:hypothetical protein
MGLTKAQLEALNDSSFPNNNAGAITPAILRDYNDAVILNTVNQDTYTTDSASFDSRIDGLATTSSVNAISTSVGLLQTFSGSQYKADSASFSSRINSVTGSSVDTGSLVTTASFNAYTASQDFKNTTFATTGSNTFVGNQTINGNLTIFNPITTGSFRFENYNNFDSNGIMYGPVVTYISSSNTLRLESDFVNLTAKNGNVILSGSTGTRIQGVEFIPFSSSLNSRILAITGSSINTASFATTGSNSFVGDQTITGSVTISGSSTTDLTVVGQIFVSSSATGGTTAPRIIVSGSSGQTTILRNSVNTNNGTNSAGLNPAAIFNSVIATNDEIGFLVDAVGGGVSGWSTGPAIYINNDALDTYPAVFGFQNKANYTDGKITALTPFFVSQSLSVSGSANFEELTGSLGAFSASISNRINNVSGSGGGNVSVQEEGTILGDATSFNFLGAGVTATLSAGTASITIPGGGGSIDTGSFATTGSNTFTGDQTILGAIVSNPTSSLIELFSQNFASGAVQYNISASNAVTQSNLIFGGTALLSTQTGSVIISGSNNILHNPVKTLAGARAFDRGYVNGNNNYLTVIPLLHTQSLFNPTVQANIGTGQLSMNFITSSIAVPFFVNNNFSTTIQLLHQSGTVQMQNNISNGTISSNQNGLTSGTVAATINNNIVGGGGLTLNHTSSSILTTTNTILGGTTVNNNYFHTGSNNSLTLASNLTAGQNITINAGGSPSTNVSRPIVANLLGGSAITIQADAVGTDLAGLRNEIVYGYNLIVSGAQSVADTTNQGGAFFGRYNDINAGLADSGKTIFAVGTGTSTSNRKTALSIDSASVVSISGSLLVNGVAVGTVNTSSFATTGSNSFNGNQTITGSLIVTGSNLSIDSNGEITASKILLTGFGTTNIQYNQQSTGSVPGVFATQYGKDSLQVYQYQGQPYAFNVNLTANQLNAYTGSEFQWGLQTNGTLSLPGGGSTYFSLMSGSTITGSGGGANKVGLDYLGTAMIMDFRADTAYNRSVYVDKGMYVSQSVGGGKPALIVNGNNAASSNAIIATGSVTITGSLNLNGQNTFASLESNTFTQTQIVSSSIYIAPNNNNNQLYLPSGSNKQTGIATLDGGNPGTVTVSNSNVTANSIILITKQTLNHSNGYVAVSSKGSGTFTITSNHNGDADVVGYMIINAS